MIRLRRQQILLNGPALHRRGLLPHLYPVLCHEIGHYACCPGTAEAHAGLCARAFAGLGVEQRGQMATVVNLYEDLLINTRLQLEKGLDLVPLLLALRPPDPEPFGNWLLRVCELRWRLPARSLSWQAPDAAGEADAMLASRLIQPRGRRLVEDLHAFAELCRPHLPAAPIVLSWLDAAEPDPDGIPAGLAEAPGASAQRVEDPVPPSDTPLRQYLEPAVYAELFAGLGGSREQALARYYRERAWPWLLPELRPSLPRGWEPVHPEGTRPWELDRPVSDIDWPASLIQSPVVVPGMTTLRRRQAWEQAPEDSPARLQKLDLYLDASGSVPDPAASCSPLVLAATILALSALRLGLAVRITCYSAAGQIAGTGFSRQPQVLLPALVSYFGGATSFPLPLLAQRSAGSDLDDCHLILLSDEGYQAALLPAPDGRSGAELMQRAAGRAAAATLVLDLLRPQDTPEDLAPLRKAGWRLAPLLPDQLQTLARRVLGQAGF